MEEDPFKTEAAPLTPDTVIQAVKEVDLKRLCGCLCVPDSKRNKIKVQYPPNAHRMGLVGWWFSTYPAPSWRRLIHGLDLYNEGSDTLCRKTADKIRGNAEPVQDPTFTLHNVTAAVGGVGDWNSLGYHLGVPSRKRGNKKEVLQYFIATVPNASWQTLAGGLYHRQEYAALSRVMEYFRPQAEATLTVANLCSVLEEVVEWDRLGYCLEIPSLIRSEIKKKYSNDTRCKWAMLEEWWSHHPAPSWMLVANALYGRFMSGNSGKYHKLLHLVKEKYLKAPEPLLEQSASSIDTPLIPSARPRMESAPEPLLEQSANSIDTPLIPSARPRMESAPETLPEQSVSSIDTLFIPSARPRMESAATLQKETVSSTPTPTPPASVPDGVDAAPTLQRQPVSSTPLSTPPASITASMVAASLRTESVSSIPQSSTPPASVIDSVDIASLRTESVSSIPQSSTPPASVVDSMDAATLQREPVSSTSPSTPPASVSDESSLSSLVLVNIEYSDLEIKEKVGSGGFGTVSKGRWISKNKIVAIKVLMDFKEREVRILSSLDHPSIIQYYGTAIDKNVHCIVTEFAENGSVFDYIFKECKQPSPSQILLWATQVAEGMIYLHQKDIIHRDLKSSNVVLTPTLRAKICDLGSARSLEHTTRQSTAVGTYAWMAPEMLRKEKVSKSCDVYSYAVLLFEIATQELPFPDVLPIMVPAMILDGKRPTIPEKCDPHLADLIECCWEQDAKARPNFQDILKALSDDKISLRNIEFSDLEFMEKLGSGGSGTVSKGRWISKDKIVAIKLTALEVRILSSLRHPSIIQYYGTATHSNVHYIVTEFAENGSIHDYIYEKCKQPPLSQMLLWAAQVAEGMIYLHQRDIIHRNLKSSNVVLTSTLKAKICDIGSARSLEHTTKHMTAVGTIAWMAPEILCREKVSKSCDVYSYGVLLFEIATQQLPFSDVLPLMVPAKIAEGKRPTIPEKCDPHLATLIQHCWKQDAKARPSFKEILVTLRKLSPAELPSDCAILSSVSL